MPSAQAMSGRYWSGNKIPDTMARKMTREQVINDLLLLAQPPNNLSRWRKSPRWRFILTSDMAHSITGSINFD